MWIATSFLIACAAGYLGYYWFEQFAAIQSAVAADHERQIQIQNTNTRLSKALAQVGVSPLQTSRGFWYTYSDAEGNESVAYFDINQASLLDYSDSDISAFASEVASSTVVDRTAMRAVPRNELSPQLKFHNALYSTPNETPGTFQNTQSALEAVYANGSATAEQLWELSYMYELQGKYGKRDEVNATACKLYRARCAGSIPALLRGTVTDQSGRPVQGAIVTILSHPEAASTITDVHGAYTLKVSALPMEKIRVSAVKRNFTDGVASAVVLTSGAPSYELAPIVLTSPLIIVTIDTQKHTVSDPTDTANADGSFVLHATSSTYQIPAGSIVRRDGSPYLGPADVYIYEFTRDTIPASLTTLDTFNDVTGYAGNLMQTLGMPYIQFFAPDGEQLDVLKSRPMLLTYQIPGMRDMLDNHYNRPEGPLTQNQLETILAVSQGDPGFPITAQFLYGHHISTFAPFWVFDHTTGVWENQGMRLLNASGLAQAPFYTVNNQ